MNIKLYFVFIYFNSAIIYAWQPFYNPFKVMHNISFKKIYALSRNTEIELSENKTKYSNNSTNHTFMDDEEFMKILRFYRPI